MSTISSFFLLELDSSIKLTRIFPTFASTYINDSQKIKKCKGTETFKRKINMKKSIYVSPD